MARQGKAYGKKFINIDENLYYQLKPITLIKWSLYRLSFVKKEYNNYWYIIGKSYGSQELKDSQRQ